MSAISLLSEVIAQGGKVSADCYRDRLAFQELLRRGYLTQAGVVASVVCDECDEAHAAQVVFENGRYGFYCPQTGFVAHDKAELTAVEADVSVLVDRFADELDCRKRKKTPLYAQTWRIGAVQSHASEVMLYFHPRLQAEEDVYNLQSALSREARAEWRLVVTALGRLPVSGAQSVQLDDLAELDSKTGKLRTIADLAEVVGMPRKNKGGRPRAHRSDLDKIILERRETGAALEGINLESKAILAALEARFPGVAHPSNSTIKRRIKKI